MKLSECKPGMSVLLYGQPVRITAVAETAVVVRDDSRGHETYITDVHTLTPAESPAPKRRLVRKETMSHAGGVLGNGWTLGVWASMETFAGFEYAHNPGRLYAAPALYAHGEDWSLNMHRQEIDAGNWNLAHPVAVWVWESAQ